MLLQKIFQPIVYNKQLPTQSEIYKYVLNLGAPSCIVDFRPKGSFTNYVDKFLTFFDHLPPFVYTFYFIKVYIF